MKERLLILGAGIYQLPLIQCAKRMGYEVVAMSVPGPYPGIDIADQFIPVDIANSNRVIEVAQDLHANGVLTVGTDACIPSLGALIDKLHLTGIGYEAALRSWDKVRMKKAFAEHGVPTPSVAVIQEEEEGIKFVKQAGCPVMVKAVDSSGSRGITRVNSVDEFRAAWSDAKKVTHSPDFIIEQYLEGIEFGAQAFVVGTEMTSCFVHDDLVTPYPRAVPIGHSMPSSLSLRVQEEAKKVVADAISALGLQNTAVNADLMLVGNKTFVLEMAARAGGTCLPETVSLYGGFNVYKEVIHLATGQPCDFSQRTVNKPNASRLLMGSADGTVTEINIPQAVKEHPGLYDLRVDVKVGEKVRAFRAGNDRIGHVIATAASAGEANKLAHSFAGAVEIAVKPD